MIRRLATSTRGLRKFGGRLFAMGHGLLSDCDVQPGCVEMRIALAQAAFVGAPIVIIAILFMAVLP
ncbi:hypothetical protein [Sphingobium sp.]|uniref:hypothetical protein n=1 Tax=Sphingobium sp. TaxID=1912891 RepID=UPI0026022D1F|nr:hypothetical protein [Sphingobium sp.]